MLNKQRDTIALFVHQVQVDPTVDDDMHSLKTTWITLLSMMAMLISSYVSSAPLMSVMMSTSAVVDASDMVTSCHQRSDSLVTASHTGHVSASTPIQSSADVDHCQTNERVHSCCSTVCGSVSYPIYATTINFQLASHRAAYSTLSAHPSVGHPIGILRPPSHV